MFDLQRASARLWRWLGRPAVLVTLCGLAYWQHGRADALAEARIAYARRDFRPALGAALTRLDRRPSDPESNRLAALSLSELAYPLTAEPYYDRAAGLTTRDQNGRALTLFRAGRTEAAEAIHRAVLRDHPTDPDALRQLALLRLSKGDVIDALEFSRQLSRSDDPKAAIVGLAMLGEVSFQVGIFEDAVLAFDNVLRSDPQLNEILMPRDRFWLHYVQALVKRGEGRQVLSLERRVMQEAGESAELVFWLGRAYELVGDQATATARSRRAIELDPTFVAGWSLLGRQELANRRPAQAIEYLNRALELAPQSYSTLYSLMLANQQLGHTDEAKRLQARIDEVLGGPGAAPAAGSGMGAPVVGSGVVP